MGGKMRKLVMLLLVLITIISFTACDDDTSDVTVAEPIEVVEDFFSAFEDANYEKMKEFCTQESIDLYFHDGDVFGMWWAKATNYEEVKENLNDGERGVFVTVEMETVEMSALHGQTETAFYVILEEQGDGTWLIDRFVTGL